MCIVCISWNKGLLTPEEALRNLGEFIAVAREDDKDESHYFELIDKILDEENAQ